MHRKRRERKEKGPPVVKEIKVCRAKMIKLGCCWEIDRFFCVIVNDCRLFSTKSSLPSIARQLAEGSCIPKPFIFDDNVQLVRQEGNDGFTTYLDGYFGRPLVPAVSWLLFDLTDRQFSIFEKSFRRNFKRLNPNVKA